MVDDVAATSNVKAGATTPADAAFGAASAGVETLSVNSAPGDELNEYRARVDELDERLVQLLAQRFAATEEIGQIKARDRLCATDATREAQQVARMHRLAQQEGVSPEVVERVWRVIVDAVVERHQQIAAELAGGTA